MVKTFHWNSKMRTTKSINGYLYFFRKIPILGKIFGRDSFHYPDGKAFFTGLSLLFSIIKAVFKSTLALGFTILSLGTFLDFNFVEMQKGIEVGIFFLYFCTGLADSKVLAKNADNFYNICVFKVNPTSLGLSLSFMERMVQFLGRTIVFTLVLPIFNFSILSALFISAFCLGGQIIGEASHLWLFRKTGKVPTLNIMINFATAIVIILCGIFFLITRRYVDFFTHPISIVLITTCTALSWHYLLHYDHYNEAFAKVARKEFYDVLIVPGAVHFADVKLKDSDLQKGRKRAGSTRTGYPYLNDLFIKRHRRMLMKPALIKGGLIVIVFLAALTYGITMDEKSMGKLINGLISAYTTLPFFLYMLCNSERITRAMFINCDYSLMRFGFYKERGALLKMFSLRLRDISLINAIPTLILTVGLMALTCVFAPDVLGEMLLISVMILILGVFFTVHYLFIYYLFQPYTEDMKIKSPMYSILKAVVYILCYGLMIGVDSPQAFFLPVIILGAAIYIIVALILVYKKAPQTFRVK